MPSPPGLIALGLVATLAGAGLVEIRSVGASVVAPEGKCAVLRIAADGRRTRWLAPANAPMPGVSVSARRGASGASSSTSVRSRSGHASSSSSSSSSSTSGSHSGSRAMSTSTDAAGRTVTVTNDQKGCSILIDERADKGE